MDGHSGCMAGDSMRLGLRLKDESRSNLVPFAGRWKETANLDGKTEIFRQPFVATGAALSACVKHRQLYFSIILTSSM
jgi:hypothetical protein